MLQVYLKGLYILQLLGGIVYGDKFVCIIVFVPLYQNVFVCLCLHLIFLLSLAFKEFYYDMFDVDLFMFILLGFFELLEPIDLWFLSNLKNLGALLPQIFLYIYIFTLDLYLISSKGSCSFSGKLGKALLTAVSQMLL